MRGPCVGRAIMREPDMDKLNQLVGKMVGEVGACISGALTVLGDRLGLYKAMADGAPVTAAELAGKTGLKERYLKEWLSAQAAAGFIEYEAAGDRFSLTPEPGMVFAEEGSPG